MRTSRKAVAFAVGMQRRKKLSSSFARVGGGLLCAGACITRNTRNLIETDADLAVAEIPPIFGTNQGPLYFARFPDLYQCQKSIPVACVGSSGGRSLKDHRPESSKVGWSVMNVVTDT